MPEPPPGLESDPVADGLDRRSLARRPARPRPAERRPSGRHGRRPARCGGRDAGRAGSSTSARASARSGWRWRSASERAFVDLVEIDPDLARLAEINAARNGLQARARVLQARRSEARRAARGRARRRNGRLRRHQPAVLRTGNRSRLAGQKPGAGPCPARGRGGRDARRLDSGLARPAQARRPVRDDPPPRRARDDPRRGREPARRARAAAGPSLRRRPRPSAADLGRQGLEGAAAHRARR